MNGVDLKLFTPTVMCVDMLTRELWRLQLVTVNSTQIYVTMLRYCALLLVVKTETQKDYQFMKLWKPRLNETMIF